MNNNIGTWIDWQYLLDAAQLLAKVSKQLVQNNFQLSVGSTRPFHCVASLHSVIGSVNSHQLDSTLRPTATWSFTFFPRIGQCYSSSLRDWLRKLAPSPQPIRFITKIKCNVVIGVFPRLKQFVFYFSFSSYWLHVNLTNGRRIHSKLWIISCRGDCNFSVWCSCLQCRYTMMYTYPYAYFMEDERKRLVIIHLLPRYIFIWLPRSFTQKWTLVSFSSLIPKSN